MNAHTLDVLFRLPFLLPLLRWWHAFIHTPGSISADSAPTDFFADFAFPRSTTTPETSAETTARLERFLRDDPAFNAAALRGRTTWAMPTVSPILLDHARPGYDLHLLARVAPQPLPNRRALLANTVIPTDSAPEGATVHRPWAYNAALDSEALGFPEHRLSKSALYLAGVDQSSALHLRRQNAHLLHAYALHSTERAFARAVIDATITAQNTFSARYYASLWLPSPARTFLASLRAHARTATTSARALIRSTRRRPLSLIRDVMASARAVTGLIAPFPSTSPKNFSQSTFPAHPTRAGPPHLKNSLSPSTSLKKHPLPRAEAPFCGRIRISSCLILSLPVDFPPPDAPRAWRPVPARHRRNLCAGTFGRSPPAFRPPTTSTFAL